MTTRRTWSLPLWVSLLTSCASPTAEPSAPSRAPETRGVASASPPSEPAEPPMAPLSVGRLEPKTVEEPLAGRVVERAIEDDAELLVVELEEGWRQRVFAAQTTPPGLWGASLHGGVDASRVHVEGEPFGWAGFALFADGDPTLAQMKSGVGPPPPRDVLRVRRSAARAGQPLSASLLVAKASSPSSFRVSVQAAPVTATPAKGFDDRWNRALSRYLSLGTRSSFRGFATARLDQLSAGRGHGNPRMDIDEEARTDWQEMMDLGLGSRTVEAALQSRSRLRSEVDRHRPTLAFSKLSPPSLPRHPWAAMQSELGVAVPDEPLAAATPADFYFVRASDVEALFALLDEVDAWLTPAARVLDERLEHYDLAERYETELGLVRGPISRELGPRVVQQLAVVGSDPFLRMGSDVSVLFRVGSDAAFRAVLAGNLVARASGHGELTTTRFTHQGVEVRFDESADHAVRRYSAFAGGVHVLSNSRAAVSRIVDTLIGKAPPLAGEPDFRYMLSRDAGVGDHVLAFAGDRFIEAAVGPRSRVLDARRRVAQAELRRPVYASMLHGWRFGRVASTSAELTRAGVLRAEDLRHFDGEKIEYSPAIGPISAWGTGRRMTPLIDLPTPTKVTDVEKNAYDAFARSYEGLWRDAIDPIALRIKVQRGAEGTLIGARLRVLPVVRDREISDVREVVGDAFVRPGDFTGGARFLFGVAENSELRRALSGGTRSLLGRGGGLDWIGAYAAIGVADHSSLANAFVGSRMVPVPPTGAEERQGELESLLRAPVYAELAVQSRTAAAAMLAIVRAKLGSEAGLTFDEVGEHAGVPIVRVHVDAERFDLFYALSDRALYASLSRTVIQALLTQEKSGAPPSAAKQDDPSAAQAVVDLSLRPSGPLAMVLTWLLEHELRHRAGEAERRATELLYGFPSASPSDVGERALSQLGFYPVTVDGAPFQLSEHGVVDPVRGHRFAPAWPKLPVPGSTIERSLSQLASLRSAMRFDAEPAGGAATAPRSFNVSLELRRRK